MSKVVVDVWRLMNNINNAYHGENRENRDKLKQIISTLEPTEEFVSEHYETMLMVAKLVDSAPALHVSLRVALLKSMLDKVNGKRD